MIWLSQYLHETNSGSILILKDEFKLILTLIVDFDSLSSYLKPTISSRSQNEFFWCPIIGFWPNLWYIGSNRECWNIQSRKWKWWLQFFYVCIFSLKLRWCVFGSWNMSGSSVTSQAYSWPLSCSIWSLNFFVLFVNFSIAISSFVNYWLAYLTFHEILFFFFVVNKPICIFCFLYTFKDWIKERTVEVLCRAVLCQW